MTQKERIEKLESGLAAANKRITGLQMGFRELERDWKVYEDEYRNYTKRKHRLSNWFTRVFVDRGKKPARKTVERRLAKKMAKVFNNGRR